MRIYRAMGGCQISRFQVGSLMSDNDIIQGGSYPRADRRSHYGLNSKVALFYRHEHMVLEHIF